MKQHFVAVLLVALFLTLTGYAQATESTDPTPFTQTELDKFLKDYPSLTQWLGQQNSTARNINNPWIMASMRYNQEFTTILKEKNWQPDRFFYLLNHINTGLLMNASENMQAETQERLAKEQQENQTKTAKQQKKINQEITAANQRQQAQIRNNPNIPPVEKQRILNQMNRTTAQTMASTPQEATQNNLNQQQQWLNNQEQAIRTNPNMHPMQRQQALAQIQQTRQFQQKATQEPVYPTQEAMQAEIQKQYKKWFATQKQALENNRSIPPAQKSQMVEQLTKSETQFNQSMEPKPAYSIIPPEEKKLINSNQQKLLELLVNTQP